MDNILHFIHELVNPESIIRYGGLYLLLFVVFAETGLFFGFFLPGDSLMFTAGLFCATNLIEISIINLLLLLISASILGNIVGYAFGKKLGPVLYNRKNSMLFKQEHLKIAREFYAKHGGLAMILCRFLPIVRTFVPIVAGMVNLPYSKFIIFNVVGAILWVAILTTTGYFLGITVPGIQNYLGYIVIFLIVITSVPFIIRYFSTKK